MTLPRSLLKQEIRKLVLNSSNYSFNGGLSSKVVRIIAIPLEGWLGRKGGIAKISL